jgi:hypothetical protein
MYKTLFLNKLLFRVTLFLIYYHSNKEDIIDLYIYIFVI